MYKHRSRPRKTPAPFRSLSALVGMCFFALSIVAPAQIQKAETRIFSQGIKVTVERSSPAFAALQDDYVETKPTSVEQIKPQRTLTLSSGTNINYLVKKIAAENRREEQLALQKQMANAARVTVVEVSREELLQSLFAPMVASLKKPDTTVPRYEEVNRAITVKPAPKTDAISTDVSIDPQQPHLIKGFVEFTNGLALTSPTDELEVYQEVEGEIWQTGTVWLRQGRYSIEVPNREGLLVAELKTQTGEVLGRGELELANLPLSKKSQYKVNDVTIQLQPVTQGVVGQVISAYSRAKDKRPVADVAVELAGIAHRLQTKKDGFFEDSQVTDGSSVMIQAQRPGYWGSLAIGGTKAVNELILYPNKMLKAFMSFAKASRPGLKVDESSSLVWGTVLRNGKPVAGAQVDLMTTDSALEPIYFNELMLPDTQLKATSSNGLYAFLPVPGGAHAVQVTYQGIISEPIVFPTQAQNVSTVNVETSATKRLVIKSFDAFAPDKAVATDVYRLGFEQEKKRIQAGVAELRHAPGSSIMILNSIPATEYVPTRVSALRNKTFAYFPMVKTSWLKQVIAGRRAAGTGVAVGFVSGKTSYRVYADTASEVQVVYFDPRGNVIDTNEGVPGGGYVIINLESGFRNISVVPVGSERVSTTTILSDSKFVNLLNHATR